MYPGGIALPGDAPNGVCIARHVAPARPAPRRLDHEGGRTARMAVLPPDRASGITRQAPQRQSGDRCEATLDGEVSARLVHHADRLMEPDRDGRADTVDQPVRDPGLRL